MTETKPDTESEVRPQARETSARVERAYERLGAQSPAQMLSADKNPAYRNKPFDSSYQSMLFGSAGTLAKPAWSDSTAGRLTIRLFTRGVLGAAMFTLGGRISRLQLANYEPEAFRWEQAGEKPLQAIAKTFDVVFGKPIAGMARLFTNTRGMTTAEAELAKANAEWNAVNFRGASYYHTVAGKLNGMGRPMNSRSLGAEMVSVSFDFAMMSVGDAVGRNFIQMIDPNIRKTWMVNDRGEKAREGEKAHFSPAKFARSLGISTWRILSKNQGEDWAVALPYVYQMRFQRGLLSKAFSDNANGVKVVLDNGWNGGAYKVNSQGKILGDYQLAGAIDLHTRFVGYNFYTLMFREAYDTIGHALKNWKESGHFQFSHEVHPLTSAKDMARYVAKSFIKANMYMNPAVVPFWLMRTPQTKWRGAMLHTGAALGENAIASTISHDEQVARLLQESGQHLSPQQFEANMIVREPGQLPIFNYNTARFKVSPGDATQVVAHGGIPSASASPTMYLGNQAVHNPLHGMRNPFDKRIYAHYDQGVGTQFSKALNPFGQFSYWLGGKATALSEHLPQGIKKFISVNEGKVLRGEANIYDDQGREAFVRGIVDAGTAYAPYFGAKAELTLRVDDTPSTGARGPMDNAIYELLDNIWAVKPRGVAQSLQNMWRLSVHRERVTMREGNENHPELIPAIAAIPKTTVQPEGRGTPAPVVAPAPVVPVNVELSEADHSGHKEKQWAEAVAGKNLEAQFQPGNARTRH